MNTYEVYFYLGSKEVHMTEAKGYSFTSALLDAEARTLLGNTNIKYDRVNIVQQVTA